ncbi:hypothetical protein [Altericista sp. CCNU0014]|uniref:hypothetical protein n=1 Tax=Altericista sp. CCNU0014 TaxID=3082949 RepID=UPI003850BACA
MRKNIFSLGLLLTAALSLASTPVRADEQVNTQVTNQSAGAVGNGNYIYQQSDQMSIQQLKNRGRGGSGGTQDNLQQVDQAAATVGDGNGIEQRSNQINVQQRMNNRRMRSGDDYYRR